MLLQDKALLCRYGQYATAFGGEYLVRDDIQVLSYYEPEGQNLFILSYDEVAEIVQDMDEEERKELLGYDG